MPARAILSEAWRASHESRVRLHSIVFAKRERIGIMAFQLDMSDPRQAHTAERLRAEEILWLASVRPDGRPHLVPVWFLWEGETILLFSKPENQKIRNLRQNPAVSVSLDSTKQGDDVTVLEGVAAVIDDPKMTTAL